MAKIKSNAGTEKIEALVRLMAEMVVDEITFDGITIKKSIHRVPTDDTPAVAPLGKQLSEEDQIDIELFGSAVKRG